MTRNTSTSERELAGLYWVAVACAVIGAGSLALHPPSSILLGAAYVVVGFTVLLGLLVYVRRLRNSQKNKPAAPSTYVVGLPGVGKSVSPRDDEGEGR